MIDFDATVNAAVNDAFGEPIQYSASASATPITVQGVFTDAYKRQFEDGEGGVGWTTTAPSVGVRAADFPAPPAKNGLITRVSTGETFIVFDRHPDGIGWLNLILKATS